MFTPDMFVDEESSVQIPDTSLRPKQMSPITSIEKPFIGFTNPGALCFLNATLQQLHALPHFLDEVTYHQVGQQATETIRCSLQDFQKESTSTTEARGSESEDGARDKSSG